MSDYTRRPFAAGNTATPVHIQPEIRGAVQKDADGEFPSLPQPSELRVETENGTASATFSAGVSMVYVLTRLNADLSGVATAEEYEGCVVIRTLGTGQGAYVSILQPISGFDDASRYLGLPVFPNPTATVRSGDLLDAPRASGPAVQPGRLQAPRHWRRPHRGRVQPCTPHARPER